MIPIDALYSLYIIRRHTLCDTPFLHLHPPIPRVLLDQHKPLSLNHAMLRIASRRIIIKRLYIFQLLGAALGRYRRSLFLGYAAVGGGARVGVGG